MNKVLKTDFFKRPTLIVAQDLLGKFLVREIDGERSSFMINEVEAYDGFDDRASHAFRGKTPRTEIMFGNGGFWYVYFVYGMHFMLNIVTGPKDYPAAILIRGAGEFNGPAKLTKALAIDKSLNGKIASFESGLWIEDGGDYILGRTSEKTARLKIKRTPRIGVNYAGKIWANKKYRFVIENK